MMCRNAWAIVFDFEESCFAFHTSLNRNHLALTCIAHGVFDKIVHHLRQLIGITAHQNLLWKIDLECASAFSCKGLQQIESLVNHIMQIHDGMGCHVFIKFDATE